MGTQVSAAEAGAAAPRAPAITMRHQAVMAAEKTAIV